MNIKQPNIRAEFELDDEGNPIIASGGLYDHYKIKLSIEGAPENTYAVTYLLHESYYDPVKEVRRDKNAAFGERITSYGDYPVVAKVRALEAVQTIQEDLSKALKRSHANTTNPLVKEALNKIEKY